MSRFFQNIKRVCEWLPILWHDRDWDYAFALRLLHYKLERMRNCIVRRGVIEDSDKVGYEILIALGKIDLIAAGCDDEWYSHFEQCSIKSPLCADCKFLLDVCYKNEERNWNELWQYLVKHMRGWWD